MGTAYCYICLINIVMIDPTYLICDHVLVSSYSLVRSCGEMIPNMLEFIEHLLKSCLVMV